jgi:outer membrane murein-binding lipoprotein Lpp
MNLESRVDTLERDVALLRTETRGWAEIAVAANRKSDMNAELLNLIYRDLLETKRDVQEMKATLVPDVAALKTDVGGLKAEVGAHGDMLREILARLP